MGTPLYNALSEALVSFTAASWAVREPALANHSGSAALPPLDPDVLKAEVAKLWTTTGSGEPSTGKRADVLRFTLEMVARDLAVRPVMNRELAEPESSAPDSARARFQTALQDRLDIVLTLLEVVFEANPTPALETGALFIPLLEEFPELLLACTWHELFNYVESRSARFAKDMPVAKGKQLSMLRLINSFLRMLSCTPGDLELRGRVQMFASRVISVADKSAINLRGEYARVPLTWETQQPAPSKSDGDVEMADGSGAASPSQPDFYDALWSLQPYFAYPPSLDGPEVDGSTPFDEFRTKSDFVLARMFEATRKERVLLGRNPERAAAARKRSHAEPDYPRYLTSRSLLEYEIADPAFRCQILIQYFILFQFLLSLLKDSAKQTVTGGMPKTFVLEGSNADWVAATARVIRNELKQMPDGIDVDRVVAELMNRERRYAGWKNDGCHEAEWDLTPADPELARGAAAKWKRHCGPMRRWVHPMGTQALSRIQASKYTDMSDFLGDPVRSETVFTLAEQLAEIEAEEEDDRAMGREPPAELAEQKRTINWLALRQARRTHPRFVASLGMEYNLHKLVAAIRENEAKVAARRAAVEAGDEIEREKDEGGEVGEDGEKDVSDDERSSPKGDSPKKESSAELPEAEPMADAAVEGKSESTAVAAETTDAGEVEVPSPAKPASPESLEASRTVPLANSAGDADVEMKSASGESPAE
ncbi:hypothetical protein CspeluHIS016_0300780 [Cutaneotrichosporon spelunceum]|uniref:THO complex subunit 1 transcription elongation factor-domain-containing protein n=1 Tax=Cutaneotrichosporon spelunceum TaxID=1672016 RepID=A0AAD3TT89_9TREE|nr:hypothetical protein CspeluHIS016_0300780 [Cutaneotrichosporon spelunceum]